MRKNEIQCPWQVRQLKDLLVVELALEDAGGTVRHQKHALAKDNEKRSSRRGTRWQAKPSEWLQDAHRIEGALWQRQVADFEILQIAWGSLSL